MKKVIQSKAFRESAAKDDPTAAREPEIASDANQQIVDTSLQAAFKAWLESEADAAALIHAMSYRVDPTSALARRARNYASRLRHYVVRITAFLPVHMRIPYGAIFLQAHERRASTPAACERALFVLVEYLLHHVESAPDVSLASTLKTGAPRRLLRRMLDERAQMAIWLRRSALHRLGPPMPSRAAAGEERKPDTPHPEKANDAASRRRAEVKSAPPSMPAGQETLRIFYNPPQVVRWI